MRIGADSITSEAEEDLMEFPACPSCQRGQLIPMSLATHPLAYWVCTSPDCSFTISGSEAPIRYFNGKAVREERAKGEKTWTEFHF